MDQVAAARFLSETLLAILLVGLLLALVGTVIYLNKLRTVAAHAPQLRRVDDAAIAPLDTDVADSGVISVIIPAYNEAENIQDCIVSVLQSSEWTRDRLEVWVVDDQSSDGTLEIVRSLQATLADSRLSVIAGQPRPVGETWMGKNWACHQAVQQATGNYLLFLDADVRLKPRAIETAVAQVRQDEIDLLTCWLTIICGCFAEWLAQPLIVGILAAALPFTDVNDPKSDTVFAVGPFMLFRRSAYEQLGGHKAVADQVVEDVELARRVKQRGLKLHYTLGHELGTLRMYSSSAALWEGWTKNWYLGSQRDLALTLYGALVTFWICALPMVGFVILLFKGIIAGWDGLSVLGLAIASFTMLLQYPLRLAIANLSAIPPRYWWLTGWGGLYVTAIILGSIIKTETGWGWTWRGRRLQLPNQEF